LNVFVDTNVLLGLYKLTGPDLEEVRRLIAIAGVKGEAKLNILLNENVVDEFARNRENVVAESMSHLESIRRGHTVPNLVRPYKEEANALRTAIAATSKAAAALQDVAHDDIQTHNLKADLVVEELFQTFAAKPITDPQLERARRRREVGRPPGKSNSIGDAINWEHLLEAAPDGENLYLISADGDFESILYPGTPKDYLVEEWEDAKHSELYLFKSLLAFLQKQFPQYKLADEVAKVNAIDNFVDSFSFAETHRRVAALREFSDFTDDEVARILDAMDTNSQIESIIEDDDVRALAETMIESAKSEKSKIAAEAVSQHLTRIDARRRPTVDDEKLDDDIPF